ncbi:SGNH/GDSL hydrolase family protein [Halobacillus shinanisalinarum]|uniref:SGNH/GDSL hydrolase family protein n=1 Tax=Halobacillus shinanisalinarum TaxID=2932258 RepID=A0ABY4H535_9BACI|nr:SGNH/GDSL hydrolase family protein [Halobacillus shinanisalinarum]UOQ95234.1 SGNH/GDSL hydrolase family protein [Halobacillus shinanisalinarum]
MKKLKWLAIVILSLIFLILILASFINQTESISQGDNSQSATKEKQTEEENPSPKEKEYEEEPVDEQEEGTLSEGLQEVFTSVIEGAKNLFVHEDLKIVAIGDSLTQGVGDRTDNGGYVGILEETINSNEDSGNINIENFGKRGNRTDQLLDRMEKEEMASSIEEADIVLITIGANDVMKVIKSNFTSLNYEDFAAEQAGYEKRLHQIIERIKELNSDAPIYLIGLYNPFAEYFNNVPQLTQIMNEWNRIGKEVISEYDQATFIPIKDIFAGREEELLWKQDHFHPNEKGYKQMAKQILEVIRPEIEK